MTELEKLCNRTNLRASFRYGEAKGEGWDASVHNWRVTLKYKGRQLTTDFFGGSMVENPNAADVIHCLVMDAELGSQSFESFCWEFGYDPDSMSAHKLWKACSKQAPRVKRLLGDDYEYFLGAEH